MNLRTALFLVASAVSLSLSSAACSPGGGCPWVDTSAVTLSPAASCIVVHVPSGDSGEAAGGCVDPVLKGENQCDVALSIPGQFAADGKPVDIAPGASFAVELALDAGSEDAEDNFTFVVSASLGDEPVTMSFRALAP